MYKIGRNVVGQKRSSFLGWTPRNTYILLVYIPSISSQRTRIKRASWIAPNCVMFAMRTNNTIERFTMLQV